MRKIRLHIGAMVTAATAVCIFSLAFPARKPAQLHSAFSLLPAPSEGEAALLVECFGRPAGAFISDLRVEVSDDRGEVVRAPLEKVSAISAFARRTLAPERMQSQALLLEVRGDPKQPLPACQALIGGEPADAKWRVGRFLPAASLPDTYALFNWPAEEASGQLYLYNFGPRSGFEMRGFAHPFSTGAVGPGQFLQMTLNASSSPGRLRLARRSPVPGRFIAGVQTDEEFGLFTATAATLPHTFLIPLGSVSVSREWNLAGRFLTLQGSSDLSARIQLLDASG